MSKWTESYNYRRTKDKFGNINCVIYISDKPVIVSEEIYKAYSQMQNLTKNASSLNAKDRRCFGML